MTLAEFAIQHPHFWNVRYTRQDEDTPTTMLIGVGGGYNINGEDLADSLRQLDLCYINPNHDDIIINYINSLSEEKRQEALDFGSSLTKEEFATKVIDDLILKPALIDNQHKINEQCVLIQIPLGSEIWKLCNKVIWLDEDEMSIKLPAASLLPLRFNSSVSAVHDLIEKNTAEIKPAANVTLNITGLSIPQISQLIFNNIGQ